MNEREKVRETRLGWFGVKFYPKSRQKSFIKFIKGGAGDYEMKIGSIFVKCIDFDKIPAFWREALHYVPKEPAKGGWVILRDPEGKGPNMPLDLARKKERLPSQRNPRLHLDLYTDDRAGEVKRLLKIGATLHPQTYDPEDNFRLLEDPDGNLFCVVQ